MKRLLALLLVTLTAVCCFGCGTESEIVIRTAERTTASASGGEVAEETMTFRSSIKIRKNIICPRIAPTSKRRRRKIA